MTFSVIGLDASDPNKKITISKADRFEQLYIIGSTRQGKSTLIENLVLEDIKNDLGVCLIDPHGDLVNNIISRMAFQVGLLKNPKLDDKDRKKLEHIKRRLENDIVYIDLADKTYVAPFNLFHCEDTTDDEAVENVVSAFLHILQSSFGISPDQHARMNQYFRHIATLLVYNQNHTMLDILQLLTDDRFMLQLVENVPDHWEKVFWKDFYAKYSRGTRRMEDISMISNKIEEFISPVMRPWFGDTKKTIHFRKLMDEKKIVLIKSNPQWETITKIMGNVVIAQLLDAAYSRRNIPLGNRKQMNVYVDEYQKFASEDFAKLFSEAAKYGLSMTISQQVREQVEPTIKAVCDQAKNVVVFRVSPANAKEIADFFDTTPPPGEPIYEKMMQEAGDSYTVEYWEPPEAEQQCKDTLLELQEIAITQHLLAIFNVSGENAFYDEQRTPRTYRELLPIALPPIPVDAVPANATVAHRLYEFPNPPDWDTTVYVYSQPLVYNSVLWNYLVNLYKNHSYGNVINYAFDDELIPYLLDTYYQSKKKIEGRGDYAIRDWVLGIHSNVRANVPYRFPASMPTELELAFMNRYTYPWLQDGLSPLLQAVHTQANQVGQVLLKEIDTVLRQFKEQAVFYFNPEGYKNSHRSGYDIINSEDGSFYTYERWQHNVNQSLGYTLSKHWEGPFYPQEEKLWECLIQWVQQKILHIDKRRKELTLQLMPLLACFKTETRFHWKGWYKPQTVTEIEFRTRGGSLESEEREHVKYRMREGHPPYGSEEVERRTAETIKNLKKYTAKIKIASGEYTITTIEPKGHIDNTALQKRIVEIQERNRKAGYLRLREEVKEEIRKRYEPQQPSVPLAPQPQQPATQPPIPAKRKAAIGKICPKCQANNPATSLFCSQDGMKLE